MTNIIHLKKNFYIVSSLEKANNKLMSRLHEKEVEYENLQEEVTDISKRLNRVKDQHSKEVGKDCLSVYLSVCHL